MRQADADAVTLIGAGITLHEAMKAADALAGDGISARVIDLYSVKPIDAETLRAAARDTGRLVTVEDHWPEGGIGDAVLEVFADSRRAAAHRQAGGAAACPARPRRSSSSLPPASTRAHRRRRHGSSSANRSEHPDDVSNLARRTRMNTLQRLHAEQDQSPWIDFIDRELISTGRLADSSARGSAG